VDSEVDRSGNSNLSHGMSGFYTASNQLPWIFPQIGLPQDALRLRTGLIWTTGCAEGRPLESHYDLCLSVFSFYLIVFSPYNLDLKNLSQFPHIKQFFCVKFPATGYMPKSCHDFAHNGYQPFHLHSSIPGDLSGIPCFYYPIVLYQTKHYIV